MKKYYIILPLIVFIFSYSCTGKVSVKPSADSLLAKEAVNRIDSIKNAYEAKDTGILRNQIHADLSESILKNIYFEKAEMSFSK